MAARWLVLRLDDGSVEDGKAKLFGSAEHAQQHVVELIDDGVSAERIQVFNADPHPFLVTQMTIVSFDSPATPDGKGKITSEESASREAAGVQNGVRLSSMFKPS